MKKLVSTFILLTLTVFTLFSCTIPSTPANDALNIIPENNINYSYLEIGNVIQDENQAVFFHFQSDYVVKKIEFAGSLLDKSGNEIYTFDTSMGFQTPSKTPYPSIRIDATLIKNVYSVSFTKVTAYTTETINSEN